MNQSQWKFAHASVTGTSHIERGTLRQDRYDFDLIETSAGDVLVVVLSDGAGSSLSSEVGAELSCSLFIQEVKKLLLEDDDFANLNREFGLLWLDYFRQKIAEYAEEQGTQIREFACTFLAAVVWEDGAVFYQVGDGVIVYSLTGDRDSYCFGIMPEKKVYANTTNFITDEIAKRKLKYQFIPEPLKDLVMFTDGIQSIAVDFKNQTPHEPFLIPILQALHNSPETGDDLSEKLENFLNSPRLNEKTDDDKTLFLASRYSGILPENSFSRATSVEASSDPPEATESTKSALIKVQNDLTSELIKNAENIDNIEDDNDECNALDKSEIEGNIQI